MHFVIKSVFYNTYGMFCKECSRSLELSQKAWVQEFPQRNDQAIFPYKEGGIHYNLFIDMWLFHKDNLKSFDKLEEHTYKMNPLIKHVESRHRELVFLLAGIIWEGPSDGTELN